jgi:hypothetical protein
MPGAGSKGKEEYGVWRQFFVYALKFASTGVIPYNLSWEEKNVMASLQWPANNRSYPFQLTL